ncbi:PREDICTED: pentatricopeptide repeat-containing protein At1g31430 [Tarenaya hassleriana]|uniref:Pentatricopeptide repeat-containing protein n=1 Tax=Tarenaya spinosa TaxID=228870 RepID=Q1KUN7_9ROSI|nr:PREDICTED: pentatricopeptide repeat-containing protein At1g31430 [Tarenaya hassleriana]ABD96949.1 hypothetical protein [Tarenaya spinosa]
MYRLGEAVAGRIRLSKNYCVDLLQSCESMAHLTQIHAKIFRVGLQDNMDTLTKIVLFCTDPSRGSIRYAERVLGFVQSPCLVMYNLMIKAVAKDENFRKVLVLFSELRKQGLNPDNFTLPPVFKAMGCLGKVVEGEKVHGYVVKSGFDACVCNSVMGMYGALGKMEVAKKVFDEIPERDVVSWNVLISSYVGHRKFEDAIAVFRRMRRESNLKADEATVVSTLSACSVLRNQEVGEEIHRYVDAELEMTTKIGNALLDMYCKCGCVDKARAIFDEMGNKNVICWTSMVSGYASNGSLDEARELFERSPVRDIVLWTAMINGYVQFNLFDEALKLFRKMQIQRLRPDNFILVTLLKGCAQTGALEQGKWLHGYIHENSITLDRVVGTALVDVYAKCGCVEKALEVFYEMKERDTASWTSVIYGLAVNGMTSKALDFFSQMEEAGFRPDDITFIGVLTACNHGGLVEEGRRYFDSMTKTYKIQPKSEHYSCLIDLLCRAGLLDEAELLLEMIPIESSDIVVPLYCSLLSACRNYGNLKMSERVGRRLERVEVKDSSVHTLLASVYASANRWEDVTTVRRKMKELGIRKFPGCSSIEVNGVLHEFMVGGPSHMEMDDIHSVLGQVTKWMLGLEREGIESEPC